MRVRKGTDDGSKKETLPRLSSSAKKAALIRLTPMKPTVPRQYIGSLQRLAAEAETGEVTAFAWVAIGPGFATLYGRTPCVRQDRVNLLGQLELLRAAIIEDECEDD